jgi:two-component system, OmpR family, sensor kinase
VIASIRVRLTLWFTAILALVLVGFAGASYYAVARTANEAIDDSLVNATDTVCAALASEESESETQPDDDTDLEDDPEVSLDWTAVVSEEVHEIPLRSVTCIVLDDRDRVIASAGASQVSARPGAEAAYPKHRDIVAVARRDGTAVATVHEGSPSVRVRAVAHDFAGRTIVVLATRSLEDTETALGGIGRAYLVSIPFALLLAAAGGYLFVRESLAPVSAMGDQADAIEASNLDRRLAVRGSDEFARLASIFNRLLGRLERAFDDQRRFMADASHELRTPVAIVRGESEVSLSQADRSVSDYRESLAIVHHEASRLTRIVDDLFTLARADAGQHPLLRTDFYLDELLSDCARAVRTLAASRELTLRCAVDEEMPFRGDEPLIGRMFVNLLDNAIKHTPKGGAVDVSARRVNSSYVVRLRDTGSGIPPEARDQIFERFFRADRARSRTRPDDRTGAGLGLPIARWIAEAHGGTLELVRSDSTGSTFEVALPVEMAPDHTH